jgi:hypothetical protein
MMNYILTIVSRARVVRLSAAVSRLMACLVRRAARAHHDKVQIEFAHLNRRAHLPARPPTGAESDRKKFHC